MQGQHFTTGATVYDSAGKKAGTVHAYNPQSGFLEVRTGWLLRKDRYIHRSAVSRADAAGVALQLSKDDLKAARYNFPWTHNEYPIDSVPHTPPAGGAWGAGQSGTTTETTTTRAQAMAPPAPAPRFSSLDG